MTRFGSYHLDTENRCLWSHGKRVALTPKAFALLRFFVEHAGKVIGHNALLDGVWRDQDVQPEVVKKYVLELRRALHSEVVGAPRIENIPRVGYLFTAPAPAPADREAGEPAMPLLVGRDDVLASLRAALARARAGHLQTVLVSGEAGAGKSAVLRAFFDEARTCQNTVCAWAGCTEQSQSDAWLPFLDMLQALAPQATTTVASDTDGSRPPMKIALARRLEQAAGDGAMVLFMDDVHWADNSSVELLAHLAASAHRRALLLVCSYRPSELQRLQHPFLALQLHLRAHGLCRDCPLSALPPMAIRAYIDRLMPRNAFEPAFYELIADRTEGHPLFLSDLLAYLREHGLLREEDGHWPHPENLAQLREIVPSSTASMIDLKIRPLGEEDRHLLLAASLQGMQFDALVVARALQQDPVEVEERLVVLANLHALVTPIAELQLPIGAASLRLGFSHALYRDALLRLHGPARRAQVALGVAEAMEWAHATMAHEVHSQIAALYQQSGEYLRAARSFLSAARANAALFANREAFALAQRGLHALHQLPAAPDMVSLETELQLVIGATQSTLVGWPNELADAAYRRVQQLSFVSQDDRAMIGSLYGAWNGLRVRGELILAQPLAQRLLEAARGQQGWPVLLARQSSAMTDLYQGRYRSALRHGRIGIRALSLSLDREVVEQFQRSAAVSLYASSALAAWSTGWTCSAVALSEQGLNLALNLDHPASIAGALGFCAFLGALRNHPADTLSIAARFAGLRDDEALTNWRGIFRCLAGWARYRQGARAGGLADMAAGLDALERTGVRMGRTYLLSLLAQAHLDAGDTSEAEAVVQQALQESSRSGDCHGASELLRTQAQAHALRGDWAAALVSCQAALDLAQHQGSLMFEAQVFESIVQRMPIATHRADWQERQQRVLRRLRRKQAREAMAQARLESPMRDGIP